MSPGDYESAIAGMVRRLRALGPIESVYQIGSVQDPGISDIDLLAVFADGASCGADPRERLSGAETFMFSHALFGATKSCFQELRKYTFFHNYRLLWGTNLPPHPSPLAESEAALLKRQIALEYLLRLFLDLSVKLTYGVVYVTGLLRHGRAVLYDLEFLGVRQGRLLEQLQVLLDWRRKWFEQAPSKGELQAWVQSFYRDLRSFLQRRFKESVLFVPRAGDYRISRHIELVGSDSGLSIAHRGILLPSSFLGLARPCFNLQNRLSSFRVSVPMQACNLPPSIRIRFDLIERSARENRRALPHFMPMASSLVMN